jgi:hypothetical protein
MFAARADPASPEHLPVFAAVLEARSCLPVRLTLASAALALRYSAPQAALKTLLRIIADEPPGVEVAVARTLVSRGLPPINGAGDVLGTAWQVHRARRAKYKLYEMQLTALREGSWGVDELDILTLPEPLSRLPVGALGYAIVTRGGRRGFGNDVGLMGVRLMIASTMLRSTTLRSYALRVGREFRDVLMGGI